MEYIKDEHRVHLIVYHLIWCPKRRKPVLIDKVATVCDILIMEKCSERGWNIISLSIQPDHVHLFVRVFPTTSASEVVKVCKGITSFELRRQFPELKKLPCMWTKSYFASTAGNVSQEMIQKYINSQSKS